MPVVSMIWNWGLHQVLDTYCMVFGVPDQTTYGEVCSVTAPVSAIAAAALANTALPWNNSDKYSKASQFIMILESARATSSGRSSAARAASDTADLATLNANVTGAQCAAP